MMKNLVLAVLVCILCSVSPAALNFQMTCDTPTIAVGQETTIIVSAHYYDDVEDKELDAGFGLVEWQFDMWLDAVDDGILEVVSTSVFEESVYTNAFVDPVGTDTPTSGSVDAFGAFQLGSVDPVSNLGVGGYTPIAAITVRGIAEGSVSYNFGSRTTPENFYGRLRGVSSETVAAFDTLNSVVDYTVVPEPTSMLIFSGLGVMAYLRRKRG